MSKLNEVAAEFFSKNNKKLTLDEAKRCFCNPDDSLYDFEKLKEYIDKACNKKLADKESIFALGQNYSINDSFSSFSENLWLETLVEKEPFGAGGAKVLKAKSDALGESDRLPFRVEYECFSADKLIKTVGDAGLATIFKSEDFKNWINIKIVFSIGEELEAFLAGNNLSVPEDCEDRNKLTLGLEKIDFLRILAGYSILFNDRLKAFSRKLQIAKLLVETGFEPNDSEEWIYLIGQMYSLEKMVSVKGAVSKITSSIAKTVRDMVKKTES